LVIGISGGVDSALTSTLCANTGKKTIVVSLPIHQEKSQLKRAEDHIKWLCSKYDNVSSLKVNLSKVFDCFSDCFKEASSLSLANSRSRLRMTALYQIASSNNGIVVGTGNKVEDFGVGFFTKYGDGGVDISPIADLTKSEVWKLAKKVGVIDEIVSADPTDGLWGDDRTDEDQIGASYPELEWAMDFSGDPSTLEGREKDVYYIYSQLNSANQHKMNPIPIWKK
jgi:NAD+ synthase